MWIEQTPEGVEIWHYTPEEWAAEEDEEVRQHSRFQTAEEFTDAYFRQRDWRERRALSSAAWTVGRRGG